MSNSARLKNDGMLMAPDLQGLKLFSSWNVKFLWILLLSWFLINLKKSLGDDRSGMSDTSNLSSKEMSFLAWEWWVAVNCGIKIACADMFNLSCSLDLLRSCIWKLYPVLEKVIIHPVNKLIYTFTSAFMWPVRSLLLSSIENTFNYPVVSLDSKDLAPESKSWSSA